MEISSKDFEEMCSLIKKGYEEKGGLNVFDIEVAKKIINNTKIYEVDNKFLVRKKQPCLIECNCSMYNKIYIDGNFVCSNCGKILS